VARNKAGTNACFDNDLPAFLFLSWSTQVLNQRPTDKKDDEEGASWIEANDPFRLFHEWLEKASTSEPNDPNGMALATVDAQGLPDVRMVLLKGADERGFVFFTNLESAKGRELASNPRAALCFHWKSLRRQIRIRGPITLVSDAEADEYFATRARDSQIGAWASRQSRPLETRFELEREVARYAAKFGLGKVPRPPHWSGFRLAPVRIEFWRDRPFRLHDRLVFEREKPEGAWRTSRLFP
jgi:pyridoxamine 5'-phosphate oxidase